MKLKNSKMKKILTCLLIGASLTGSVGANAFANSNSSGGQYASKEASDKIIKEIQAAYKSRSSHLQYSHYDYPQCCWLIGLRGELYAFTGFGRAMTGRWKVADKIYYFDITTLRAQKGWYNVNNNTKGYNGRYYFGEDYAAYTGDFRDVGYERFCFDDEGRIKKGFMEIGGRTYLGSNKTGALISGWWSEGNNRYFFDRANGYAAHEGWYKDGNAGYMHFDGKGRMTKGLQNFNPGETYLFQPHGNGANYYTASGFYTDEKTLKRYYFNPEYGNRALMDTWLDTSDAYYKGNGTGMMYFNKEGCMANGVTEINGNKYLFLQPSHFGSDRLNAYQCDGWYTEPFTGNRYYFNPEKGGSARSISNTPPGAAVKGVQYIDGVRYEFGQDGVLKK